MLWVGVWVWVAAHVVADRVVVESDGRSSLNQLYQSGAAAFNDQQYTDAHLRFADLLRLLARRPDLDPDGSIADTISGLHERSSMKSLLAFVEEAVSSPANPSPTKRPHTAIATLVTTDEYVRGAVALANSLLASPELFGEEGKEGAGRAGKGKAGLDLSLVALVFQKDVTLLGNDALNSKAVSAAGVRWLQAAGWEVRVLDPAKGSIVHCPCDLEGCSQRAQFLTTCAKLNVWSLVDFDGVLYVDADTIVLNGAGIVEMLEQARKARFAAVSSPDWPESKEFQSATFFVVPSLDTFAFFASLPSLPALDFSHDMQVLNAVYGSVWVQFAPSRFDYHHHVAQTGLHKPIVPRDSDGRLDMRAVTMFDFSGPPWGKPWQVVDAAQPGSLVDCRSPPAPLQARAHEKAWGAAYHREYFGLRERWRRNFHASCGRMLANDPALPSLPPLPVKRQQ